MTNPIPIHSMDQQVEVIQITAPPDSPNALTIGPIFQQFGRLEELHIVRSNIPSIGRYSFWGVPTLQKLNLTENNISHVLDYNFRGLANLLELYLDDNRIESMPSGTFRYLHELRVLSLARNRITELVPRLFLMLGKLHQLDLSNNRLMELNPEVFKDVQVGDIYAFELKLFVQNTPHSVTNTGRHALRVQFPFHLFIYSC
jgi:Leucine-rich repeat (LRR) protein